jgi:hypothetical protein
MMNRGLRPAAIIKSLSTTKAFYGVGLLTLCPTRNMEDQGSHYVWIITFDLSDMGDTTSSYATSGIVLRIIV